jgi:hypothetical protein
MYTANALCHQSDLTRPASRHSHCGMSSSPATILTHSKLNGVSHYCIGRNGACVLRYIHSAPSVLGSAFRVIERRFLVTHTRFHPWRHRRGVCFALQVSGAHLQTNMGGTLPFAKSVRGNARVSKGLFKCRSWNAIVQNLIRSVDHDDRAPSAKHTFAHE